MDIDKAVGASTTTLVPSKTVNADLMAASVPKLSQASRKVSSITSLAITDVFPQPLPVGREFVRQFYNMMGKSPKNLYRFYSVNSTLTFGNNPILIGQDKIRKDIERRGLRNCHAYIIKIDSQPTLGNGIVVQVIGELSNNDEPMRPFTQTFVLSPLVPKNYYVYNEIFRYQDEVYREINLEALRLPVGGNQLTTTTITDRIIPCTSNTSMPPSEPATIPVKLTRINSINQNANGQQPAVVFLTQQSKPKANYVSVSIKTPCMLEVREEQLPMGEAVEKVHITSIPETNQIVVTPAIAIEKQEPTATTTIPTEIMITQGNPNLIENQEQNQNQSIKAEEENITSAASKTQIPEQPVTSLPLTYANVFKSSSGLLKAYTEQTPSMINTDSKSIFIRSAVFTSSTSSLVDSQSAVDVPNQRLKNIRKSPSIMKNSNAIELPTNRVDLPRAVKSACFQQQRRSRNRRERYGEGLQLFLGNLPNEATVEALTKLFKRYGTILELRVLSKPVKPGMRQLPNYGFLTYDSRAAVQRCLANTPFFFPENQRNNVRLNVRPKNIDEEPLAVRSRRRSDKRRRAQNTQEALANVKVGAATAAAAVAATTSLTTSKKVIPNTSKGCLLQTDDWPQLRRPHSQGAVSSMGLQRRKKDSK